MRNTRPDPGLLRTFMAGGQIAGVCYILNSPETKFQTFLTHRELDYLISITLPS